MGYFLPESLLQMTIKLHNYYIDTIIEIILFIEIILPESFIANDDKTLYIDTVIEMISFIEIILRNLSNLY